MDQAEQSIQHVGGLAELKLWGKCPVDFKPQNLGTHCCEFPARKASAKVQMLVEANSKPQDIVIYTDGSVISDRSGWGFTAKQDGMTVHEDSGAHRITIPSLTMEVEAVTHTIE